MTSIPAVPASAMTAMALCGVFAAALPIVLAVLFWKKAQGRWRFFFVGCVVFPLFALVLEQTVHALVLGGDTGRMIQQNVWLYALYGGLMAGIFEECGRLAAFWLCRPWQPRPGDALMYGAGHGGIEAILLVGLAMLSNLLISLAVNSGGETLAALVVSLPEDTLALLANTPAGMYFWSGFERLCAVGLHIALSMLVYAAVCRKQWRWFFAAILIHALVDAAAVLCGASLPVPATEGVVALLTLAAGALAARVYRRCKTSEG